MMSVNLARSNCAPQRARLPGSLLGPPALSFAEIEVTQWDKVMAVNLRGPFLW
jgi:NAD(P)-dependent dehydrogenase (short-subunit alcohol dehydrogenase family)